MRSLDSESLWEAFQRGVGVGVGGCWGKAREEKLPREENLNWANKYASVKSGENPFSKTLLEQPELFINKHNGWKISNN